MSHLIGRLMPPVLLALASACGRGDAGGVTGPRLTARWTGADTSTFGAPAVTEWCGLLNLLEVRAVSGDTGIGLALFRRGGIEPGEYPIRRPEVADTTPPSATLALRWFSKTAVQGFQADSGSLAVRRGTDRALFGRFRATARSINGSGRLTVSGTFEELRVRPATRGCAPPSADSGGRVH